MNRILLLLAFTAISFSVSAQENIWSGLKEPQRVLPAGNAPLQKGVRVPFMEPSSRLEPSGRGEWIICDGWTLREGASSEKYNATVPGTALTTLINQGVYPDPYYGLNNMAIPDSLSRSDWWYEIDFNLPAESISPSSGMLRRYILFNGINYRSEIFLNGIKLGETRGAFERGMFDITALSASCGTVPLHLQVHVFPPEHPGIPHEQSVSEGQGLNGGATSYDGPTFLASVGWDWMPAMRDRNTGIWQDVRLICGGSVRIGDPLTVTDLPLPDTTSADIRIEVPLRNDGETSAKGTLTAEITPGGIRVEAGYSLRPGEKKTVVLSPRTHSQLKINNPRLWWPNGYGEPFLYKLTLTADEIRGGEKTVSDEKKMSFGIRELSYELMAADSRKGNIRLEFNPVDRMISGAKPSPVFDNEARILVSEEKNIYIPSLLARDRKGLKMLPADDPAGPNLIIKVNGVRIFCRGGDWGMDDALKRSSRERLEPFFILHKDLNFNIIRNWTGETTQESFYQLCDEYGMLVWNDFWMTGEDTVGPLDYDLFLANAKDVVRRFRCHPSIAVWGPRNEGFAPKGLEKMLSEMLSVEDPTRHYHGQSRFLNMGTSGPWNYFEDSSYYFTERADGFNTEMGSFSVPTASTIRKFIAPQDRWPINDVWAYHDLHHTSQNFEGFMRALSAAGAPENRDEKNLTLSEKDSLMELFANAAQGVCYDAWRAMLEAWNSKMWDNTTGIILWMSHPAWPSFIWQTYSYDGEKTGAYYGARKACERVHVQMNPSDNMVSVINVTRKDAEDLIITATVSDSEGNILINKIWRGEDPSSTAFTAKANSQTKCFILDTGSEVFSSSGLSSSLETSLPLGLSSSLETSSPVKLSSLSVLHSPYEIRLELRTSDGTLISENIYYRR